MSNNWKVKRKEGRVALSFPMRLEILSPEPICHIEGTADDISRDGFHFRWPMDTLDPPMATRDTEMSVRLHWANRTLQARVRVVRCELAGLGFQFLERDKGWVIN